MYAGLDGLTVKPVQSEMLRFSIHVLTYLVGCGSKDNSISKTPYYYFGLLGLWSTASVPTVP